MFPSDRSRTTSLDFPPSANVSVTEESGSAIVDVLALAAGSILNSDATIVEVFVLQRLDRQSTPGSFPTFV